MTVVYPGWLDKRRALLLLALMGLLACFLRLAFWQPQLVADEAVHVPQITGFMSGSLETRSELAMIPGYHAVAALVMKVAGLTSLGAMRGLNAIFGLGAAMVFYAIRRKLGDGNAFLSAAMFYVFPLFYPYYFLAYTDILSMMLVLMAVLSALHERHLLAACIVTLSLAVRQNNVVWAGFLAAYTAWPWLAASNESFRVKARNVLSGVGVYVLPVLVFLLYWRWNGAIVFSPVVGEAHPDLSPRGGNVWFALFLFLLLFPREACKGLQSFWQALRRRPWLWSIPVLAACIVRLRGSGDNHVAPDYFIRNAFVLYVAHGWARPIFGLLIGFVGCALAYTRFREARGLLVYPFSIVCLSSSILIENRYAMVPFALWMAFREENPPSWMLWGWVSLSLLLTFNVLTLKFML